MALTLGGEWMAGLLRSVGFAGFGSRRAGLGDGSTHFLSFQDLGGDDTLYFSKTTDGGATWSAKKDVDTQSGNQGGYHTAYALDANNYGIAHMGGTGATPGIRLCKTTDGGTTWACDDVYTSSEPLFPHLAMIDSDTYIICAYRQVPNDLVFIKTTNGGTSWTVTDIDSSSNNVGLQPHIAFVDADTYLIFYRDAADNALRLLKTIDGGDNWSFEADPSTTGSPSTQDLFIVDADTYLAMFETGGDIWVSKTTDGGATWVETQLYSLGFTTLNNGQIFAIDSDTYIAAHGSNADLVFQKTTDGGATWSSLVVADEGASTASSWTSIFAVDADTYIIGYYNPTVDDYLFIKSTNGGDTWGAPVEVSGPFSNGGSVDLWNVPK